MKASLVESRRTILRNLGLSSVAVATLSSVEGQALAPSLKSEFSRRSVKQFGARGDGRADDTEAFNAATQSTTEWNEQIGNAIYVPPGRYRITGPIRVRKGQRLIGDGEATLIDATNVRGPALTLGLDARGREDPGGAPVAASALRFLGGNGSEPVIKVKAAGFLLSELFLSAAGTAIEVSGSDGVMSGITVDQALRGLVFRSAQNILVQGLLSYLVNFAVTLDTSTNDIVVAQAVLAYSRFASVLFADGASDIRSVHFANCDFVSNESLPTFLGHIHIRSNDCDAQFSACMFRNHPGFAVRQQAGVGAKLTFNSCVFDGSPSNSQYSASVSSAGLLTGAKARITIDGCHFRNLHGPAVAIGPDLDRLVWQGGSIQGVLGDPLRFDEAPIGRFTIRAVDGFGRTTRDGSLVLPWSGAATIWRIAASTMGAPAGFASAFCMTGRQGTEQTLALTSFAASSLTLSVCFGEHPGGPDKARGDRGLLCVSAEGRHDIQWSAETLA